MHAWWDDLRFGLRMLARNRSVTLTAILTLALGIGVNTAIFSTVAAYFWTPLPYPEPERLVWITGTNPAMGWTEAGISLLDGSDWRAAEGIETLCVYRMSSLALSGSGEPQNIQTVSATPELFDVLKVRAAQGRTFGEAERSPGEHRVAVITDGLWRRHLGADPRALGSEFRLDGKSYTLIGVLPRGFHCFYTKAEVFIPLHLPPERATKRDARSLRAIARLKPDATVAQAAAQVRAISLNMEKDYPATNRGWIGSVRPADEMVIPRGARVSISTMYYAVTVVLLIACVNLSSLLLSRGTLRQKELAIRAALGAGRASILRLLLTESLLLGILGGALGIAFAYWAMPGLRSIAPQDLRDPALIVLDARGLAYGLAVCVASGLLAGLLPALVMSRGELAGVLRSAGRGHSGSRHFTLRALVVAEVVLSVVLLAGGSLIVKSILAQLSTNPGFEKTRLMTATVSLPPALYAERHQVSEFFRRTLDQMRSDPRVVNAAAVQSLPLGGSSSWTPVTVESRVPDERERNLVGNMLVTPGYFETMGIPLVAGRAFQTSDGADAPPVVIVNQTMAGRYWPGDLRPLGRRIKLGDAKASWLTVVGVARDVRHQQATVPARPEAYVPHAQSPANAMILVARTHGDPHQAAQVMRSAVWSVDRRQPLYNVETMEELLDRRMAGPRATAQVMAFLALLALVLASVGIYGVVGYIAAQRTREIGIRLALGAGRAGIFAMVLQGGLLLAAAGLVLGFAAAAGITPLLRSILSGVTPHDAASFALSGGLLLLVAIAATLAPAFRAMRLDPIQVLREE